MRWAKGASVELKFKVEPSESEDWQVGAMDLSISESPPESYPFCWRCHLSRKTPLASQQGSEASPPWQDQGNVRHTHRATWHPRSINILNVDSVMRTHGSLGEIAGSKVRSRNFTFYFLFLLLTMITTSPECREKVAAFGQEPENLCTHLWFLP
jgi:hypothetical protein